MKELSLEDKIRKDLLELITRSYEDEHPFSLIIISLKHIGVKYSEDFK